MLSRPLGETTNTSKRKSSNARPSPSAIPSIRLVTSVPSATGLSSDANSSFNFNNSTSFEGSSWGSIPSSVLAPKPDSAPKRRLVPKKSKLGLLNVVSNKGKENGQTSNLGNSSSAGCQDGGNRSFDVYVDPTIDPDIGEIMMVKKKKSRAALDGMHWGPLGEVTNIPASSSSAVKNENAKEDTATRPLQPSAVLKLKGEEKDKWWSIGRGRNSVKEGKENRRRKCKLVCLNTFP
jgi:serine/arginine repetitive matrix protein 2